MSTDTDTEDTGVDDYTGGIDDRTWKRVAKVQKRLDRNAKALKASHASMLKLVSGRRSKKTEDEREQKIQRGEKDIRTLEKERTELEDYLRGLL